MRKGNFNKEKQKLKKTIKLPKPWQYQKQIIEWLDDPRVKVVSLVKSRQTGGSYLSKLLCSKWLLSSPRVKVIYVTPTYRLARRFYDEFIESMKGFIYDQNKQDLVIKTNTASTLQFVSAEAGEQNRGLQCHYLIIDEAAYVDDNTYNMILKPFTTTIGYKTFLCSTPNGAQGFFYQNYMFGVNDEPKFKSMKVTIYDNPLVDPDEIDLIRKQLPERAFQQEYMSDFLSAQGAVFTNVKECINKKPTKTDVKYFAGIDWGSLNDSTVVTIMNDKHQMVDYKRLSNMEYTTQVEVIVDFLNKYKPVNTISESNSIGQVINEMLRAKYKGRLSYITLDNTIKRKIIEKLIVAFENKNISILDDDIFVNELLSFTCSVNTKTMTIKYGAPTGLHDDCVISLAYAEYAIGNNSAQYLISFI